MPRHRLRGRGLAAAALAFAFEIVVAVPPGGAAEELTLEAAVRRAVSWHPSIDEAVSNVSQKTDQIDAARAGYYPRVTGGVSSTYYNSGKNGWEPRVELSVSQTVYDFGKVSSSVEAAKAGMYVSRAEFLLAADQLIRDTAHAVIEVQRNRALLTVAQEQVVGVEAISELVMQRNTNGASTLADRVQAQARTQAAKSTVLEIASQLRRQESNLANLIGMQAELNVVPGVPSWLPTACNVSTPDWTQVPAMMRATAVREKALAELERSRAEAWPTLSLEAGVGSELDHLTSRKPEFSIGLNLEADLYEGGAIAARRRAAGHALSAANAAQRTAHIEVRNSLMQARTQIDSLTQLLASLGAREDMMRQTRDLYSEQYLKLGTRTLLDLLNAEQELHLARFDAVNVLHDLRGLNINCLYSTGLSRDAFALGGLSVRGMQLSP